MNRFKNHVIFKGPGASQLFPSAAPYTLPSNTPPTHPHIPLPPHILLPTSLHTHICTGSYSKKALKSDYNLLMKLKM